MPANRLVGYSKEAAIGALSSLGPRLGPLRGSVGYKFKHNCIFGSRAFIRRPYFLPVSAPNTDTIVWSVSGGGMGSFRYVWPVFASRSSNVF